MENQYSFDIELIMPVNETIVTSTMEATEAKVSVHILAVIEKTMPAWPSKMLSGEQPNKHQTHDHSYECLILKVNTDTYSCRNVSQLLSEERAQV